MAWVGFKNWADVLGLPPSRGRREALSWLMLARLVVVYGVLAMVIASQIVRKDPISSDPLTLAYLLMAVAFGFTLVTAISQPYLPNRDWVGAIQITFDTAMASAWLVWGSAKDSQFALVYLVIILISSLTFYQRGALFSAVLASAFYGAVVCFSAASESPVLAWSVYAGIFISIGVVGGYLSEELLRATRSLAEKSEEVEKLTALYEKLIEGMPTGLLTVDNDLKIRFMNPGAEHILNQRARDTHGKELKALLPDLLPFFSQVETHKLAGEETLEESDMELSATGTELHRSVFLSARHTKGQARLQQTVEMGTGKNRRILRGDVAEIDVGAKVGNLFGEKGTGGRVLLFQDVTKLLQLEEKLKQNEKLAAVGQLAAGIAHEIRNPLASMSASVQMLQGSLPKEAISPEDQKLMEIVVKEIDRLNGLITEFLDFVKPEAFKQEPVDLGRLLSEVGVAVRQWKEFQNKITLKENLPKGVFAYGSETKLRQVVWNLLTNAVQAMKRPGEIRVGCELMGAHSVSFWVEDDGEGMTEDVQQHLYEPFFTTKDKGTGLGLATAYKIIEAHQGEIKVTSVLGKGTRFEIHLHRG